MKLSVVLCTHNPRPDYLTRTLAGLAAQTLARTDWELILVDNASAEPVAGRFSLEWHPHGRHVREAELGLTAARLRGIREAAAELLVYVDDDNVLAPDYLEETLRLASNHPHLGAFGAGVLEPEFESPPAPEIVPLLPRLALRTASEIRWTNNCRDFNATPWGAGLVTTKATSERFAVLLRETSLNQVLGRRGTQLTGCEDGFFTWAAVDLGKGFGIFPSLRIVHLISARRVSRPYMVRMVRQGNYSEFITDYLFYGERPRPFGLMALLRVLAKLRGGWFEMRCRWAALAGESDALRFIARSPLRPLRRASPAAVP